MAGYEYLLFRENGTFEFGREKRGEAVGLWTIGDKDIVEIHLLTSPAFYVDVNMDLSAYHGTLSYFNGIVNLTRIWQTGPHENQNPQLPTPPVSL